MIFYIVVILVVAIAAQWSIQISNNKFYIVKQPNVWLPFLIMCLISGLRSFEVGADNAHYVKYFLNMDLSGIKLFNIDSYWIYNVWAYLIGIILKNGHFFNLCCAVIIAFFLCKYIKYFSTDYTMSSILFVTLGFFWHSMNQTRQELATVLMLYAMITAHEKKYLFTILLCILAVFTHNAVIITIPIIIYFMLKKSISIHDVWVFAVISLIIIFAASFFIYTFSDIFVYYSRYLNDTKLFTKEFKISRVLDLGLLCVIQLFYIYGYYKNRDDLTIEEAQKGNLLACFNFVAIAVAYLAIYMTVMTRVKAIFFYADIALIPFCINHFVKNKRKQISYLVCFLSIIYLFGLSRADGDQVIPYYFLNS